MVGHKFLTPENNGELFYYYGFLWGFVVVVLRNTY